MCRLHSFVYYHPVITRYILMQAERIPWIGLRLSAVFVFVLYPPRSCPSAVRLRVTRTVVKQITRQRMVFSRKLACASFVHVVGLASQFVNVGRAKSNISNSGVFVLSFPLIR